MNEKTNLILDAAAVMFSRYGFSKTTMGDIAAEAGVARQTVYNAFPSKEEILKATVRRYGDEGIVGVQSVWASTNTLVEKIDLFHQHVPMKWYETMHSSPEWADLMEGMHKAASEEVSAIDDKWRTALTDIFTAEVSGDTRTAADIVDFFYNASVNAKHGARDLDHLRKRLSTVKAATLALIAADAA